MKPLMAMVLSSVMWAQDPGLKARELFYSPPPDAAPQPPVKKSLPARIPQTRPTPGGMPGHSTPVANVPLGLRYSVMKRDGSGKFVEVDPDSTFRSGDAIRLNVDANSSGYLYVVAQGSSGNWKPLFPSEEGGGSNRIEKGSSQQIPPADKRPLVFDQQTGTEKLFLVLSRKPEADLDKLIYSITGGGSTGDKKLMAQATVGDDVVNRLREEVKSRDLVFEKIDEMSIQTNGSEVKTEKATYVVNPNRTDEARLVVDVALKHGK